MDDGKCRALKAELEGQAEQLVAIDRFFDGNDDLGSIGCNLMPHPGIEAFREALVGLLRRADVQAVFAQISELDPGEGSWPFADTVIVVGAISADELRRAVSALEPDEVGPTDDRGGARAQLIWWD